MSKEAEVENMVAHVDSWGGVDVMFNNAGIMHGEVERKLLHGGLNGG